MSSSCFLRRPGPAALQEGGVCVGRMHTKARRTSARLQKTFLVLAVSVCAANRATPWRATEEEGISPRSSRAGLTVFRDSRDARDSSPRGRRQLVFPLPYILSPFPSFSSSQLKTQNLKPKTSSLFPISYPLYPFSWPRLKARPRLDFALETPTIAPDLNAEYVRKLKIIAA